MPVIRSPFITPNYGSISANGVTMGNKVELVRLSFKITKYFLCDDYVYNVKNPGDRKLAELNNDEFLIIFCFLIILQNKP